jgi:two-component sensor histidine kinase
VQALALFKRAGNRLREADVLKNIGDFDNVLDDDLRRSMKEEKEALAIYISIGYQRLYGVYIILANLCQAEADYPNMLTYSELAVKYGESTGDTSLQMARIYDETGKAYMQVGKPETAVAYERKAIGIVKKYDTLEYFVPMIRNLCYPLLVLRRNEEAIRQVKDVENIISSRKKTLPDYQRASFLSTQVLVYGATKQYDKAEPRAKEFAMLLKKHPATDLVYLFASSLVGYYTNSHQGKEAETYADSLLRFARAANLKQSIYTSYLMKSRADSAFGDLLGALTYYQRYKKMTDSVFNETSGFQLAQVQVELETEKKDNDIKTLQQQQDIQKVRLGHSRTINIIVIIGVAVLALLLILLYSRYRIKHRLNREKDALLTEKDALIREKDWLVKEIHHRVKNNLEIVISLLNAQTEFLENPSALSAIQASRERMEAIAIIHRKLYQAENNTLIHVQAYAYELLDGLQDSFACARDIYFQLHIADIALDISQSVPLGLILNEAITNAIKYAYPKGKRGTVSISLQPADAERIELRIADQGKGLPPGLDWKNSPSLGLQLINLLAQQLKGDLCFINNNGLEIVLIFKPTRYTLSAHTEARPDQRFANTSIN